MDYHHLAVYTQSGRQISRLSDIQESDHAVFARLDRENLNIPDRAVFILAVYDRGIFYSVNVSNTDKTGLVRLPNNVLSSTIKVFVWEDFARMNPVFDPLIIGGESQ